MAVTLKITGLPELERKLVMTGRTLDELVAEGLDSAVKRALRGGKGLGAQRNPIVASGVGLMRTVRTPLHRPRTTGASWSRFQFRVLPNILRNVINKRKRQIEQQWSA